MASHLLQVRIVGFVTFDTVLSRIMLGGIHCQQLASVALGIGERGMATQAEFATACDFQGDVVVRMTDSRAVAVFALDRLMGRGKDGFQLVLVTIPAIVAALIFDLEICPVIDGAQSMVTIGEVTAMHSEVRRHIPGSDNEEPDNADRSNDDRTPNMVHHLPSFPWSLEMAGAHLISVK